MIEFLLLCLAIGLLSLSMDKHYKDCFNQRLTPVRKKNLRTAGWILLIVSLVLPPFKGIEYVLWCCDLSMAILLQAILLSVIKRHHR